ncbi:VOC family protein [Methylobrevis pamukkalensis]|uniref:Glyoxalase-like domain protein n=1 Tax=Methylobrevis pamukkalensis TaxID=1439726 RepID=A0A1E3GY62_9HYPH|nr:VOC family protein [Methylobrevis pamukkalensis]ODN68983.1 Glyoxalase-like domain protein [Methylobrevis pamukkalensis]
MSVAPHLHLVTLGVDDLDRATAFYEALGWRRAAASQESVTFIQLSGVVLGLYGRVALAEDVGVPSGGNGFRGITLAHNADSEAEVDRIIAEAVAAGARLVKSPQKVFWGGYSGYFADPDGHLWEVAHNPFFAKDAAGRLTLE